jgi:peptidoglycan/LPS O-acetylase OafA/YrhL
LVVAGFAPGASLIVSIIFMNTTAIFASSQDLWVFPIFGLGAFVVGMGLAEAMKYGLRSPILLSSALVLAVLRYRLLAVLANSGTAIFSTGLPRTLASVIFMPFVGLLILAAATADLCEQQVFLSRRTMVRLGEWSFALYVAHELLLRAAIQVGGFIARSRLIIDVAVEQAFVMTAIAVAGLVYRFYEEPTERWLRPVNDRTRLSATWKC